MKRRKLTAEEILLLTQIRMQRAQVRQEQSRALPQRAYGNPADFVKFDREKGKKK